MYVDVQRIRTITTLTFLMNRERGGKTSVLLCFKNKQLIANSIDLDQTALKAFLLACNIQVFMHIQSNFNGSNTYGTMKISWRQG